MGKVSERITGQLPQSTRTVRKSIFRFALVTVFLWAAANGIQVEGGVSPGARRPQQATGQAQEFYVSLSIDQRDQPGLSTLIVAGSNRLMFDCGPVPVGTPLPAVTALFLTHLDLTTADRIDQAHNEACMALPTRSWGPPGTHEWMLQTVGDRALDIQHPPLALIEVREGMVSEIGNVAVAAIETAPARFAYRVGFQGRSVLIASDVTYSEHVVARSAGVDIVVFRHSAVTEIVNLVERIKPRLVVVSQDGRPATVAQIRQHYGGPVQILSPGAHRIHVLERLALDDDINWPQR